VLITVSSDRGLCGGIHSSVSKYTKRTADASPELELIVLGDKAKAQLSRSHSNGIQLSFNQLGKASPTYAEACAIVDTIQAENIQFDQARIVYNHFRSVIAYDPVEANVYSEEIFKNSGNRIMCY
jgi:F-type H+-transporting ATPase subunit gamma